MTQPLRHVAVLLFVLAAGLSTPTHAAAGRIAREAAEQLIRRFGREVAEETAEALTKRIGRVALAHGDEAVEIVRRHGPLALRALEEAGEEAPTVIRLFDQYGDDAVRIAADRTARALCARHGDDAARALMRHPGVADDVIVGFGREGAEAISRLSSRNARRLAMLAEEGAVPAGKQGKRFLNVLREYGDEAMDFVWKNKGALTVTTTMAAFLHDPKPFIGGARGIAKDVAEPVVKGIAAQTNWTVVLPTCFAALLIALLVRSWWHRPTPVRVKPDTTEPAEKSGRDLPKKRT